MIKILIFSLALVGSAAAQERGGRGRTKRSQPSRPEPSAGRKTTSADASKLLSRGSPTTAELSSVLASGSTGALPSTAKSRDELSASLSKALDGKSLSSAQSAAVSDAVAAAANPDGLAKDEVAAKRKGLDGALAAVGVAAEARGRVLAAYDVCVSEQQKANLVTLRSDLAALQAESAVTQEQVKALAASLMAMADGATKPSQASVNKLAADLSAALDDGDLSVMEQAQLARDLESVLTSANVTQGEFDAVVSDVKAVLAASNVDKGDVSKIVADLQSIYPAVRKKK